MSQFTSSLLAAVLLIGALTTPQHGIAQQPQLDCSTGPLTKTYGGTSWLVYACSDSKSVVVLASPGNPASPFYFMLTPQNGKRRLYGEGTGKKSATEPAFTELSKLSEEEIAELIASAKTMTVPPQR
jgi:hypothetical protein